MADEQTTQPAEQSSPTSNETWQEVGQQFRALGESLATAVRAALENEETRRHMQELQTGLKAMINEVDQAVRDVAASPEGQRVRTEVEKAAQAGAHAGQGGTNTFTYTRQGRHAAASLPGQRAGKAALASFRRAA